MKNILLVLFCFACLTACKKEYSEQFVPYTNNALNDTAWKPKVASTDPVNELIPALETPPMVDSFDMSTGGVISFQDHLQLTFPANICTGGTGATLTGKAKIEVTYLRKKGDFIRFGKPTTSYNYLLQTGGSFNVTITQSGYPVLLAPGAYYKIKYRNAAPSNDMKYFYETAMVGTSDTTKTWTLGSANIGSVNTWQQFDSATQSIIKGYELTSSRLSWVNCDFFNDSIQPHTRVNISLPLNFTNVNTSVYLVFKSKNIIAALKSDVPTKTFYCLRIPIGSEVTLVSISKVGNDYYLGHKDITAINTNLNSLIPEQKPLTAISSYLDGL